MSYIKDTTNPKGCKVLLTNVRFNWTNGLFHAHSRFDDQKPKFGVTLLVDKNDAETMKVLKEADAMARQKCTAATGKKMTALSPTVIYDGAVKFPDDPELENCMVIRASAKSAPDVFIRIDPKTKVEAFDESEIKSGDYGQALADVIFYDKGVPGITVQLLAVCKDKDGEPLGTVMPKVSADDFD